MKDVGNEIFDVVDKDDVVIGRECRSEVHRRGLRHRAVHILVFNDYGQLFLQKRSMSKDTWPGTWDSSASGHLDAGEGYETAAVREIREELGVVLDSGLTPLFKIAACHQTGQEFVWVYRGRSEGPFVLHPEEIECGRWFSPDEVDRLIKGDDGESAPALRLIWTMVRDSRDDQGP